MNYRLTTDDFVYMVNGDRRAVPVDADDVPRQRLDLHLDHHRSQRSKNCS